LSKLDDAIAAFCGARDAVRDAQQRHATAQHQRAAAQALMEAAERDRAKAARSMKSAGARLQALTHAEVAGYCGEIADRDGFEKPGGRLEEKNGETNGGRESAGA